jgi:hypothetical protein
MVIGLQRESRFRWLEPIKNKKRQKEKSKMKFKKSNTEWALGGRDLCEEPGLGPRRIDEQGFGSER